jgi:iron complex outermembrane receptor protein
VYRLLLSAMLAVACPPVLMAQTPAAAAIDIPAGPLPHALDTLGEQSGVSIMYDAPAVDGLSAHAVSGRLTPEQALRQLLSGTDMTFERVKPNTYVLKHAAPVQDKPPAPPREPDLPVVPGKPASTSLSAVVVTGTRSSDRTVDTSLAPIDVISADTLRAQGTENLGIALARLVPSLSFVTSRVASDALDAQRPAQMRGLSPDETLVLVDGKRWHNAAMLAGGSTPVDLDSIPMAAVDHIEVLRDGASAQYGSDAIAGVVNVILKKGAQSGYASLEAGRYQRGGGDQWSSNASLGLPLGGDKGWLRVTVNRGHQDATNHGRPDDRYPWLGVQQGKGNPSFGYGHLFLDGQYDLSPSVELYGYAGYHRRDSTSWELWRAPYQYATGSPIRQMYPNGFQPRMYMRSTDNAIVFGARGKTQGGWHWDVSANYGGDHIGISTLHTANLALLADTGYTPGDFHDGKVDATQDVIDADFSKELEPSWLPNTLNLAFGLEYLRNTYRVDAGNPDSYYVGDGSSGFAGGAQSFNGFSPESAGSWSRFDYAEYLSLDTNLTDRLAASLAVRHEDYSDFGNTTSGALSGRFDFTDRFAIRASVSNGFRAPSLAQQYYSQVGSLFISASGATNGVAPGIYQSGLLRVDNPIAQLLGARPLKPEKSRNVTIGFVAKPTDSTSLSLDLYQIYITDRIVQSSSLQGLNGPSVVQYFADNGITSLNYSVASFFTNAANTRTRGADLLLSHVGRLGRDGTLTSTLSYNYNKNKVTHVEPNPPQLDALGLQLDRVSYATRKGALADSIPRSKLVLGETFVGGRWTLDGNLVRYGRYTVYSNSSPSYNQVFSPQWVLDLSASYDVDGWTFTVGSNNVTNSYPDKVIAANNDYGKAPYSTYAPDGFNGRYYYARVTYHW